MALPSTTIHEVQSGGSDTLNGGGFDPANGSMAADGAATVATSSSPVFTSASAVSEAGDVGHYLFVKSGTNWIPGWYPITGISGNGWVLGAAFGSAVTYNPMGVSTVTGCATVTSPTGATWSIDYSQSTRIALTGLTTAAANAIILTASASKKWVANNIFITGGTNFTTGVYNISSVSAGVSATVDRTCTSAAGSAGTAGLGGPFATPGFASGTAIAQNAIFAKSATYGCSSTADVAGGRVLTKSTQLWEGYQTLRTDMETKPIFQSTSNSMTLITTDNGQGIKTLRNIEVKLGVGTTTIKGVDIQGWCDLENMKATNCTNDGFTGSNLANHRMIRCEANACNIGFKNGSNAQNHYEWCVANACTTTGFDQSSGQGTIANCISNGSAIGYKVEQFSSMDYCIAYGGTTGITVGGGARLNSCISYGATTPYNVAVGFTTNGSSPIMRNCAGVAGSVAGSGKIGRNYGFITLTADPFTNAAGNDFSLNATAGGGALLKGLGYPTSFPGLSTNTYPTVGAAIPASSTDPGEANVRSGTGYSIEGASLTGTCAVPSAGNVKNGVAVDATTGTLLSTDPGEANVLDGTTYTIESVAKEGAYVSAAGGILAARRG